MEAEELVEAETGTETDSTAAAAAGWNRPSLKLADSHII